MRQFPKTEHLSIAIQVAGLRRFFPCGETSWTRSKIRWIGDVIADDCGRSYKIELIYDVGNPPKVFIRKPNLKELAGDRKLPHLYDESTQELCLYLPGRGFWTPKKSIASTVMLWACLWCKYFELWLVTNVWFGPEEHPEGEKLAA